MFDEEYYNTLRVIIGNDINVSIDKDLEKLERDRKYELAQTLFSYTDFSRVKNLGDTLSEIMVKVNRFYDMAYDCGLTPKNGNYR